MSTFKFNQDITVNGKPAVFVAPMSDGRNALVCMRERKGKPNVIVPLGELAQVIQGSKVRSKPEPVLQVTDSISE